MTTKCILVVCSVIAAIAIYWPARHARHYDYIDLERVYNELLFSHIGNSKPNLKNCDYEDVIVNNSDIDVASITVPKHFDRPGLGDWRGCCCEIVARVCCRRRVFTERLQSTTESRSDSTLQKQISTVGFIPKFYAQFFTKTTFVLQDFYC
jgi:hypothetical protein